MFRQRLALQSYTGLAITKLPFHNTAGVGLFRLGVINCRNSYSFSTIPYCGCRHTLQDVLGWVNPWGSQSLSIGKKFPAHVFRNASLCVRRAYASRPVSPGVKRIRLGYEPELPHPVKLVPNPDLPPPPRPGLVPPNPEDFIPHSKIKLVQHGFLITWVVALLLVKASIIQWNIKRRKSQNHEANNSSTEKDHALHEKYGVAQSPGYASHIGNTPAPNRILSIMGNHFYSSPSFIYPIPGTWSTQFRPWTAFTHTVLHDGFLHLACCYISFKCFVEPIVFRFGPARFVGLFFAGGGLSTFLHSTVEKLINPAAKMTMEETRMKLSSEDVDLKIKKDIMNYHRNSVGSSGAIISLGIRL